MLTLASQRRDYAPVLPVHCRRLLSSILSSFSWCWDGIATDPQDFPQIPQSLTCNRFLISWKQFEADVLSLSGDMRFQDMLKVLAIGVEISQESSHSLSAVSNHATSLTSFDYQRLCTILAGYKFAELLILRYNIGSRVLLSKPIMQIHLPPSNNAHNTPYGFDRLRDWPSVFTSLQAIVTRNTSVSRRVIELQDTSNHLLVLIRLLVQNECKSQYIRIENNLLHAALHIYALTMGIFPRGDIPNLPSALENSHIRFTDEISQQEYAEANKILLEQYDSGPSDGKSTNARHASLCAPLHLALFISPLYLLLPFRIVKYSFHRRPVIEVAHRLGPHKPQILVKFENLVWDAVFAIAERPLDMKNIIFHLVSQISAEELDAVSRSPEEINWFKLTNDLCRLPAPAEDDTPSEVPNTSTECATSLSPLFGSGCPSDLPPSVPPVPPATSPMTQSSQPMLLFSCMKVPELPKVNHISRAVTTQGLWQQVFGVFLSDVRVLYVM